MQPWSVKTQQAGAPPPPLPSRRLIVGRYFLSFGFRLEVGAGDAAAAKRLLESTLTSVFENISLFGF